MAVPVTFLVKKWTPVLSTWGLAAGVAVLFFGERIPRLRQDIFSRLPVIGDRWENYRKQEDAE